MRKRIILTAILTFMFGLFLVPFIPVKAEEFRYLTVYFKVNGNTYKTVDYDISGGLTEVLVISSPENYRFSSTSYPIYSSDGGEVTGSLVWDDWSGGLVYSGSELSGYYHADVYLESTVSQNASLVRARLYDGSYFQCGSFYEAPAHVQSDVSFFAQDVSGDKRFYVSSYTPINCTCSRVYCVGDILYVDIESLSNVAYVDVTLGYYVYNPDATPTPTPTNSPSHTDYSVFVLDNSGELYVGNSSSYTDYLIRWDLDLVWRGDTSYLWFTPDSLSDFSFPSNYSTYGSGNAHFNLPHINKDSAFNVWNGYFAINSFNGIPANSIYFSEYTVKEESRYMSYHGAFPSPSPTPIPTYATPTPTPQYLTQSHFQGFMLDFSTGTVVKDFDITPFGSDMFAYGDYVYLTIPVQYYFSSDDFPITTTDELWSIEIYDDGSSSGETSLKCMYLGSGLRHTNSFVQIPVHFDIAFVTPTPSPVIYPWDIDGYFTKTIGDHSYKVPNKIGLDNLNQFDVSQFSIPFNKVITYCMSTSFNLFWFLWLIPICVIIGFFIKNH